MARILILFAHPALEKSRVHRRLIAQVPKTDGITLHDLYEAYPSFDVDIGREQELLLAHEVIVMQHPFYWYNTPALLKQWQDLVLEHGWAYGSKGTNLRGKRMFNLLTAGGRENGYRRHGHHHYTVRELLVPLERTAVLCNMKYLPPYVIFGTHWMTPEDIASAATRYHDLLLAIREDRLDLDATADLQTLNEAVGHTVHGCAVKT